MVKKQSSCFKKSKPKIYCAGCNNKVVTSPGLKCAGCKEYFRRNVEKKCDQVFDAAYERDKVAEFSEMVVAEEIAPFQAKLAQLHAQLAALKNVIALTEDQQVVAERRAKSAFDGVIDDIKVKHYHASISYDHPLPFREGALKAKIEDAWQALKQLQVTFAPAPRPVPQFAQQPVSPATQFAPQPVSPATQFAQQPTTQFAQQPTTQFAYQQPGPAVEFSDDLELMDLDELPHLTDGDSDSTYEEDRGFS